MNHRDHEFSYIMYARKSSEYEDSQIQSIKRQTEDLAQLIAREQLDVYHESLCESKSAFHPGREEFAKLVKWTMEGKVNAWLCWHANRLSRNPVDTGTIIYLMDQGKLHHIRTRERIYYNTPSDKFHLQLDLSVSKKDSDDKSALIRSGILRRHRRGYPNGLPPLGYMLRGQGRSGHSFWVVDKERFAFVKKVFDRFLKGTDSLRTICGFARDLGLRTPHRRASGGRPLSQSAIRRNLLGNNVYAGFFYGSDGQRYLLDETLPRAVTEENLMRVREILGARFNVARRRKRLRPAAYRGIISDAGGRALGIDVKFQMICDCRTKISYLGRERCPKCDSSIENLKNPKYLVYTYYFSTHDRKDPDRIAKVVEEKRIDAFVIKNLAKLIRISPQLRDWAVKTLDELEDEQLRLRDTEAHRLEDFRSQHTAKRRRLRELYVSGQIDEDEFRSDSRELEETYREMEERLTERDATKTDIEKIFDLAVELENVITFGDAEAKNQALKDSRSNLTWDGESLFICNVKRVNVLIEMLKSAREENPAFEPEKCVDTTSRNPIFMSVRPILWRGVHEIRT